MIKSNQQLSPGAATAGIVASHPEDNSPVRASELKLTLKELARASEVSERTIRYYIQQGVLPPPQGAGPASCYGLEHLTRLSLVRRFKAALLPLCRIKELLTDVSVAELEQVAEQLYRDLAHTNPVVEEKSRDRNRLSGGAGAVSRSRSGFDLQEIEVFYPPRDEEVVVTEERFSRNSMRVGGRWNRILVAPGLEIHYEEDGPQDRGIAREKLAQLVEIASRLYDQ